MLNINSEQNEILLSDATVTEIVQFSQTVSLAVNNWRFMLRMRRAW